MIIHVQSLLHACTCIYMHVQVALTLTDIGIEFGSLCIEFEFVYFGSCLVLIIILIIIIFRQKVKDYQSATHFLDATTLIRETDDASDEPQVPHKTPIKYIRGEEINLKWS